MKKLQSSAEVATGKEDSVFTVPVIAEHSDFAESSEYVVQLESDFPADVPSIEDGAATDSPADPDHPVRRAA